MDAFHVGEIQPHLHEESIDLGFGQGVGGLQFQRVEGGKNDERRFEPVGLIAYCDSLFLHRLEQRRLRLGRCPVNLIGKHDIGEHRTGLELQNLVTGVALLDDIRSHDVRGHQVGCELDSRRLQVEGVAQRLYEPGLSHAGNALEDGVALRKYGNQEFVDDLAVADDNLGNFGIDPAEFRLELFDVLVVEFDYFFHLMIPCLYQESKEAL